MAAPRGGPGAGSAKSGQAAKLVGLGAAAQEATGDDLVTGGSNYNCLMAWPCSPPWYLLGSQG